MTETASITCPQCGEHLVTEGLSRGTLVLCAGCRNRFRLASGPVAVARATESDDDEGRLTITPFLLPVGRSGWAIAAGYMGLFSVLPLFGLVAIATGLLAWRDLKKHPRKRGLGRTICGLVMGALSSVAYGILLLSAIAPLATKAIIIAAGNGVRHDPLGVSLLAAGCVLGVVCLKKRRLSFVAAAILLVVVGAFRILAIGQPG